MLFHARSAAPDPEKLWRRLQMVVAAHMNFSTSNVVDLNGAVNISLRLTNDRGSNDLTIRLAATIIDANGLNNNIALAEIDRSDNFVYDNAAAA
jgi:hypothetical protein